MVIKHENKTSICNINEHPGRLRSHEGDVKINNKKGKYEQINRKVTVRQTINKTYIHTLRYYNCEENA